jgi:hypothetical protein
VQRSMHYNVSLRPFIATVEGPRMTFPTSLDPCLDAFGDDGIEFGRDIDSSLRRRSVSFDGSVRIVSSSPSSPIGGEADDSSPFMCTPQSFPATPNARQMVMAQWCRRVDDAIINARDKLRLHDGLESEDERTRDMALLLSKGKRLAVFAEGDASNGIALSSGKVRYAFYPFLSFSLW